MKADQEHSAWNPGINSEIPEAIQSLETIYNPAYSNSDFQEIQYLSQQTGLSPLEMITLKPDRLAMHEVIVRVTADIWVREGRHEEELGIRFRETCLKIFNQYITPQLPVIEQEYMQLALKIENSIKEEIQSTFFTSDSIETAERNKNSLNWKRLFFGNKKKTAHTTKSESQQEKEFRLIANFRNLYRECEDLVQAGIYRSLYRVLGNLINHRGFLGQDLELLVSASSRHALNKLSTQLIAESVRNLLDHAISVENLPSIPNAENPVLISLKGTSASGKSSLRPRLQQVFHSMGIENQGYGIISPDIWRKLLLDYASLGASYKYAGRLTSLEVNIIDAKLDRYIRKKSQESGTIPHLLVDRFRFDSFDSNKISKVLHNTYVKNVNTMFMYFVITPPEATVERGWLRGLERGRYKSVEDFLGHSVEAYSGIPPLFFKWMNLPTPRFVFEFLDNSVEKGNYPELIAKGEQGFMDIIDPLAIINIMRYQRINVMARDPAQVYPTADLLSINKNIRFLKQCIDRLDVITFTDRDSKISYLKFSGGHIELLDTSIYKQKSTNREYAEIFKLLCPERSISPE